MNNREIIERLEKLGFIEEVPNQWIKVIPGIGCAEEFTDCAILYLYSDGTIECFLGGVKIEPIDEFFNQVTNYCTTEELMNYRHIKDVHDYSKIVICQALGTIPTQANHLYLPDRVIEDIKNRAYTMCLEMLNVYGVSESELDAVWGGDI